MKLSGVLMVTLLAAFLFTTGCKEKAASELIVKKWKFENIAGPDATQIPDSMKKEMYKTATMEFKKDGIYELAGGMRTDVQKGTYTLSEDGKTIITKDDASEPDTVMVIELSEKKLVVGPKKKKDGNNIQVTLIPN